MAREMKNSGVKWIGEIPKGWEVKRLKNLFVLKTGTTPKKYENGLDTDPLINWFTPADVAEMNCELKESQRYLSKIVVDNERIRLYPQGSLIFVAIGASAGKIGYAQIEGYSNQQITALIPKENCYSKYSYYCMLIDRKRIRDNALYTTLPIINNAYLSSIKTLVPPLPEQQAIADFLDAKCAEIDGLLADLDAEVKTLAEYKKSIIAETVTRGLNPNAPMKQSGIPWAETIPAHWRIQKGKYAFCLLQRPVKEDDGVITCFRDGEVTLRSNRREDGFTMSAKEYGYQGIEPGDLVVHGMDGFTGSIGISDSRGKGTPVLNVLDSDHNKRYLMYYLRNMAYGDVFLALSTGIRVRSCDLSWKKLGEIRIVLPPIEEQNAIAAYLDKKCAIIEQSIADKQTQIETLKSYKASLIYEYVTGKKQVI